MSTNKVWQSLSFLAIGISWESLRLEVIMNASLTPELKKLGQLKIQPCLYGTASEVIREALRLMDTPDEVHELKKDAFRSTVVAGLASLRAGKALDDEDFLAGIDAELVEHERNARA
jgi:antitoxin ParD1/3/4